MNEIIMDVFVCTIFILVMIILKYLNDKFVEYLRENTKDKKTNRKE